MTDVGVSLALRQQNNLLRKGDGTRIRRRSHNHSHRTSRASTAQSRRTGRTSTRQRGRQRDQSKKKSSRPAWVTQLIEGASIYGLCVYLPGIVSRIVAWYRDSFESNGIFYQLALKTCSSYWFSGLEWCIRNTQQSNPTLVLAPDAEISDVAIVGFLCLFMAVIRLSLVHFLVPDYNQPKRLEALVRCKSVHLLSSSYSGTVTPRPSLSGKTLNIDSAALLLSIPSLDANDTDCDQPGDERNLEHRQHTLLPRLPRGQDDLLESDPEDSKEEEEVEAGDANYGLNLDMVLDRVESEYDQYVDEEDMSTAPAVSSGLMTSSSALSLQHLLHSAAPSAARRGSLSHVNNTHTSTGNGGVPNGTSRQDFDRIFAAPKFATASFRMLFCSTSCVIALIYFKDADFWPPSVGGTGSTKACWDLSSVGFTMMDPDFDIMDSNKYNSLLRKYYLVQLSYHLHSGAFHILAALLLWFVSSTKDSEKNAQPKVFGIIPAGMWTMQNLQSLFQHSFAVGLMIFTYLFSSLRRLGVIAMFSFDLSSWFLHLLQMAINAPTGSKRVTPFRIRFLHNAFVIPVFCYCRFYIFPFVVGYSALEESQDWLRQLENMLAPGTGKYIHGFFVVSFCLKMLISIVYARRLLNHPHVTEALDRLK